MIVNKLIDKARIYPSKAFAWINSCFPRKNLCSDPWWVYKLYLKQCWNLARRAGISHMRFIYQKTRYEKTSGDRHRAKFTKPPARNWRNSQWEIYLRKLLPAQARWRIKHICEWGLHNDIVSQPVKTMKSDDCHPPGGQITLGSPKTPPGHE